MRQRTSRAKGIVDGRDLVRVLAGERELEQEAAAVIAEELPEAAISLSHEIGRIGLLERENATIMNACLRELAPQIVAALPRRARRSSASRRRSYLSQNDGTLMSVDFAERYPVATFASGPTNSMRGAALPLRPRRLRGRRHRRHDLRRRRAAARLSARGVGGGRDRRRPDELPHAGRALARARRRQLVTTEPTSSSARRASATS